MFCTCTNQETSSGDHLEVKPGSRLFDVSATAWLISQGVSYLNSINRENELASQRVAELLRQKSQEVQ